jgi:hypothetical protein
MAGCGGRGRQQVARDQPGHATLRFSGAVTGTMDSDLRVSCLAPREGGKHFGVSLDAEPDVPVGGKHFSALDIATSDYSGPRTYDLAKAVANDDFSGDEFFLLFQELGDQPFGWGKSGASGTVTIDKGEQTGSFTLQGWRSGNGSREDVQGSFRCGKRH